MYIKTETRKVNVELKLWNKFYGNWNMGIFDEVEAGFPVDHERDEETGYIVATDDELNELIEWWDDECDRANDDWYPQVLEHSETGEWALFVTDMY